MSPPHVVLPRRRLPHVLGHGADVNHCLVSSSLEVFRYHFHKLRVSVVRCEPILDAIYVCKEVLSPALTYPYIG